LSGKKTQQGGKEEETQGGGGKKKKDLIGNAGKQRTARRKRVRPLPVIIDEENEKERDIKSQRDFKISNGLFTEKEGERISSGQRKRVQPMRENAREGTSFFTKKREKG